MWWEPSEGLASMGARTFANDCSPESWPLWKRPCRDRSMCRTRPPLGEADVLREEPGRCTGETSRGRGPSAYARIAEITSGRAISQQGLATTCKDPVSEGDRRAGEGFGLAHEPV